MRRKNPWAICTSSVGRKDKNKYERCVKSVKNEAIDEARHALAEACWKGYKARGMKKKGNRMVPNCVKETRNITPMRDIQQGAAAIRKAAADARRLGKDQVKAAVEMQRRLAAQRDKKHYGVQENDSNFSDLPDEKDINNPNNPVRRALQKRQRQQKNKPGPGRKLKKGEKPEYHLTRKAVMGSSTRGKAQRANTGRMVQFTDGRQRSDDDERFGKPEPLSSINRRGGTNKSKRIQRLRAKKFKKLDNLDPRT